MKIHKSTDNVRGIFRPPRCQPGSLQTLPTKPWLFNRPMNAYERSRLTYGAPSTTEVTGNSSRKHWQFRDHASDDRSLPEFVDLRGGPANVKNVAEYDPRPTPYPEAFQEARFSISAENLYLTELKKDAMIWDAWIDKFGSRYVYYKNKH